MKAVIRFREFPDQNKASGFYAEEDGTQVSPTFGDLDSLTEFYPSAEISAEALAQA